MDRATPSGKPISLMLFLETSWVLAKERGVQVLCLCGGWGWGVVLSGVRELVQPGPRQKLLEETTLSTELVLTLASHWILTITFQGGYEYPCFYRRGKGGLEKTVTCPGLPS